jgi:hypothetical protein
MFQLKPDFEQVMDRYEAWWDCEIIDRPLVCLSFPRDESKRVPWPKAKEYSSYRDRWMDIEYRTETAAAGLHNTVHFADNLPIAWPNLGPEIFSAFYGCEMVYSSDTGWTKPILEDWSQESVDELQLDLDGFYFRKLTEYTDLLLEAGKGKFIVGYTDMHGGGDAIAAFRDPQQLCIDMIEHREEVKALCDRVTGEYLKVYDMFYDKLSAAGMPSTSWCSATCGGKYYIPSNDFSCMISNEMFEETFLPGIIRECQHMDRSIYHLDGPQALRYLDTLLAIPEIHAIQWVPGAGRDYWGNWIEVYQRIQEAGKAMQMLSIHVRDLGNLFDVLRPEGVWLSSVSGISNREEAEAALKAISRWGR